MPSRFTNSNLIEIAGAKLATSRSGLAILWDDGTQRVWLPLSQVELADDERSVLCPEWLARDKGLI